MPYAQISGTSLPTVFRGAVRRLAPQSHPGAAALLHRAVCAALLLLLPASAANAATFPFLPQNVTSSTVPANGDLNPYGVAIVPFDFPSGGTIQPGDILVSNFNNSMNLQGTGSTIVKLTADGTISPSGSATTFFQGPAGVGLTTALGVLSAGFVIVGNTPTTDGTLATIQPGSLLVIDRNGNLVSTIAASAANTLDGPWDLTLFDLGSSALLFVSNVLNGTVSRLTLAISATGVTVTNATVIATGYMHVPNSAALVLGPTGLALDPFQDMLFVASTGDNAIYAIPSAGNAASPVVKGTLVTQDPHLRGPLALAFGPNGDLLAANGDAVNADPTQPSEIVQFTESGTFVTEFNVDAGQGGAFGLAVGQTPAGFFSLVTVDDVANSIQVYPLLAP